MALKFLILLFSCLMLFNLVQLQPHFSLPQQRSTEARDSNIDAVWYKGRGIRPVGRFGRRGIKGRSAANCRRETLCSPCCYTNVYMSSNT